MLKVKAIATFSLDDEEILVYGSDNDDSVLENLKEDMTEQLQNLYHELDFVEDIKLRVIVER